MAVRENHPARRLPGPWLIEELDSAFKVTTADGIALAYVYFRDYPTAVGEHLTKDEARRVAVNIAKLPGLLSERAGPS